MSAAPKKQSDELAAFLRSDADHGLDELRRARLERQFLSAARERAFQAALESSPLGERLRPTATPKVSRRSRTALVSVGVFAAAAAAWLMTRPVETPRYAVHTSGAASEGEVAGNIEPGTEIALAAGEEASVELFDLAVRVSERSRFRVEAVSLSDVRVALSTGEARFAFHPRERGHQNVAISTPAARIEIVGTELTVRVGTHGTEVVVHEGVVRVIPTSGEVELVHAGGSITVPAAVASAEVVPVEVGVAEVGVAELAEVVGGEVEVGEVEVGEVEVGEVESGEVEVGASAGEESAADGEPAAPSDAVRLRQAVALLDRRDRDRADAIFEDLAEHARVRSIRADAWAYLGASHVLRGDRAAALAAYEHAVALSTGVDRDNALFELAMVTEGAEASRAAFARYLAEYPTGSNAARARTRLCALGGAEGVSCP